MEKEDIKEKGPGEEIDDIEEILKDPEKIR